MKIKTYVINLLRSTERKQYMEKLLYPYDFLDIEFVEAIDGHIMDDNEIQEISDEKKTINHLGHKLTKGEIGCSLSHHKCYNKFLKTKEQFALILEDDISIIRDLNILKELPLHLILNNKKAEVLFLSGDYWYYRDLDLYKTKYYTIKAVYSAVGAYAFLVNRKAAKKINEIEKKVWNVADGWDWFRECGITYKGIYPYIIDANLTGRASDVLSERNWGLTRKKMALYNILITYKWAIIKKILSSIKKFESKNHQDQKW